MVTTTTGLPLGLTEWNAPLPAFNWRETPLERVHFTALEQDKGPAQSRLNPKRRVSWQKNPMQYHQTHDWLTNGGLDGNGGLVGWIPGTAGLYCFDVDRGGNEACAWLIQQFGMPYYIWQSRTEGHWNLYYPVDAFDPPPDDNGCWQGGAVDLTPTVETVKGQSGQLVEVNHPVGRPYGGDLRHTNGYMVLWPWARQESLDLYKTPPPTNLLSAKGWLNSSLILTNNSGYRLEKWVDPNTRRAIEYVPDLEAVLDPQHPEFWAIWQAPPPTGHVADCPDSDSPRGRWQYGSAERPQRTGYQCGYAGWRL